MDNEQIALRLAYTRNQIEFASELIVTSILIFLSFETSNELLELIFRLLSGIMSVSIIISLYHLILIVSKIRKKEIKKGCWY